MFGIVENTRLTSRQAVSYFDNIEITGATDSVARSVVSAIVHPKMVEDEKLTMVFTSKTISNSTIRDYTGDNNSFDINKSMPLMNEYFRGGSIGNSKHTLIKVVGITGNNSTAQMDFIENGFTSAYGDKWVKLQKITEFFKKQFRCFCFINESERTVAVFRELSDASHVRHEHYLLCCLPAILPWYFKAEDGMSEEDIAIIYSLREKSDEKFIEAVNKIAKRYDFRANEIKKVLGDFENWMFKSEIQKHRTNSESYMNDINDYSNRIADAIRKKELEDIFVSALEEKLRNNESTGDVMEYFLANENIEIVEADGENGGSLRFMVKGYIEEYDEDVAETTIDNDYSVFYSERYTNYIPKEEIKRTLRAIFVEKKLKFKTIAMYSFRSGRVYGNSYARFGAEGYGYFPNPHIDRYECLGDYSRIVNAALEEGDYLTAIDQCVISARSLNFGDSPVISEFANRLLFNSDFKTIKCVEFPDGTCMSFKEAAKRLLDEETEKKEG